MNMSNIKQVIMGPQFHNEFKVLNTNEKCMAHADYVCPSSFLSLHFFIFSVNTVCVVPHTDLFYKVQAQ